MTNAEKTTAEKQKGQGVRPSASGNAQFWGGWLIFVLPLGYLWFRLINSLRLEWDNNPQYGYGWVVPLLCIGLAVRRYFSPVDGGLSKREASDSRSAAGFLSPATMLFLGFAFLSLPTRLIEEATPEWRPIQWSLAMETIGLSICSVYMLKGKKWCLEFLFPLCFFLVAVPWPSAVENPVIQFMSRVNANVVVEVLGIFGTPAIQHGNVIEVSTGVVGINDACSGIRSFQSSLMISLFLGEFYRLSRGRRFLLVPAGFLLSFLFNVCRTSFLTWVAAKKGTAAIAQYHDPAGLIILVACTLGLWGLSLLFIKKSANSDKLSTGGSPATPKDLHSTAPLVLSSNRVAKRGQLSTLLPVGLILWLISVEIGVQLWYRSREAHLVPGPTWSVCFPTNEPSFKELPINKETRGLLRYDEGKSGAWGEADGTEWQAYYFDWVPGRVAGYLAKRHTPEICLVATGQKLISGPDLVMMKAQNITLPVRCYTFDAQGTALHVFHCRWESGAADNAYVDQESARFNLIRAIWAGRGNHGQKVLEFVAVGYSDMEQAKEAMQRQLEKAVVVK